MHRKLYKIKILIFNLSRIIKAVLISVSQPSSSQLENMLHYAMTQSPLGIEPKHCMQYIRVT